MMPHVARSKSRGRFLSSSDLLLNPAIDFCYFTDPDNHDIKKLLFGLESAKKIAAESPFKNWLVKDMATDLSVQSDERTLRLMQQKPLELSIILVKQPRWETRRPIPLLWLTVNYESMD